MTPELINKKLSPLVSMLDQLPNDCLSRFLSKTIPKMVRDVLFEMPSHFASNSLPYLESGTPSSMKLTPGECFGLVSCTFFCIPLYKENHALVRDTTFVEFFKDSPRLVAKLTCLVEYFNAVVKVRTEGSHIQQAALLGSRDVEITRIVGDKEAWRGSEWWLANNQRLTDFIVHLDSERIEDHKNAAHADFANRCVGGGVLSKGCVQEEVRMIIAPELLVACLVCAPMDHHEAVIVTGTAKFTTYEGYDKNFNCTGLTEIISKIINDDCHSFPVVETDEVLCIDAIPFRSETGKQYEPVAILRELEKVRIGLSGISSTSFATGNWGCGVFGGDPKLKSLIQWIAASVSDKELHYYPFGDVRVADLKNVVSKLSSWTVGELLSTLFTSSTQNLFEHILRL